VPRYRSRSRFVFHFSYYERTLPRQVEDGLRTRSQRGQIGRTWWSRRWIESLECLVDPGRLTRGRRYARSGQVIDLKETRHGVEARVQGSRRRPYKVQIALEPLADAEWERVADVMAAQAMFSARLLAGEMPDDIETAFAAAGVSLFPGVADELVTDCSCPDWANPCKHVAAVHYILGERFDEDPFLLFRLRGMDRDKLLAALRKRWELTGAEERDAGSPEEEPAPAEPLEASLGSFWATGQGLEGFPVHIAAPPVSAPLLRRLGQPAFMADPLLPLLGPTLAAASRRAIACAFGEATEPDADA
jgi:uncharacterized Zn finger protein